MLVHAGLLLKAHKGFQQLTQDTMKSGTYLPVMILSLDKLFGIIRRRKRGKEFTSFLKIIRRRYPNERRLIVILDNFSPHKKKEVFNWCRRNGVWLIFTATNTSWMNRIEAQFGSVSYFVLKSSYPKNHRLVSLPMIYTTGVHKRLLQLFDLQGGTNIIRLNIWEKACA